MTDRAKSKPRTLQEILEECRQRAHRGKAKPLPLPPPDAPTPPASHHDPKEDAP